MTLFSLIYYFFQDFIILDVQFYNCILLIVFIHM